MAFIEPGIVAHVRIRVRRRGVLLAGVSGHGLDTLPRLIEEVAAKVAVDRWEIEVNAFQAFVLQHAPTIEVCGRLGITLEPRHTVRSA